MSDAEMMDRRSYPPRDVTMVAPFGRADLNALVCLRRSGLTPTDETFDRVLATALSLMRAERSPSTRREG